MSSNVKPSLFHCFANSTARAAGHPASFAAAVLVILAWAAMGPVFGYSDTWQLVINTGTTIVTFLMVFLIQNSQNREAKAVQLKLDEIIRALEGAHNTLLNLEDLDEKELDAIHKRYTALAERARQALERGEADTEVLEVLEETAEQALGTQARKVKAGVSARKKARAERHRRGGENAA
ncbi:MAG TPA: low affinity iron permease family protein [Dongiaceae bacterium]|nr:low affinity iron permease family protein [Dongiaceae bacterium]